MRFLSCCLLGLLVGIALPLHSASICSISGDKAYPTPGLGSSAAGCATAVGLGDNTNVSPPTLSVSSGAVNPFPLFQSGQAWSFSAWVNPSPQASGTLFVLVEQANSGFDCSSQILSLQITSPNDALAGMPRIGQCNNQGITFNGTATFGAWNHLVYQYDGANSFQAFLNGVSLPFASGSSVFTPGQRAQSVTSVYLNPPENNSPTQAFGQLSTLRVYKAPLSDCQVQSDLAGLRQPGLLAEYASQYTQLAPFQLSLTDAISQATAFPCNTGNHCGLAN